MSAPLSPDTSLALLQATQVKQPNMAMSGNTQRINDSAREFEAVFISEMMKPMFEGIKTDELFGGGKGEEIFRGIMLQEYGKDIASRDVIGIQTQVKSKLIEMQVQRTAEQSNAVSQNKNIIDLDITEQ